MRKHLNDILTKQNNVWLMLLRPPNEIKLLTDNKDKLFEEIWILGNIKTLKELIKNSPDKKEKVREINATRKDT